MNRWLFAIVALGGTALPLFAQKSPEDTVKSMTVADGLQVELFAAEPMVINPTSIDVDHLGRVWVCEAVNYRRTNFGRPILREAGDRIVILTDKDGDGKADDSTVFYQGKDLYGPLGIAVAATPNGKKYSYKVFVCQSPDILLFEDADGDGKADGPPKKFLTGFKGFDHDHGVHGINIGPDGKFYFTVGDQGVDGLQSSDGKGPKFKSNNTDCRAGTVWRCDMDGKNLELIAHNFRNNYECCVNSFGEIWLSDNDDDGNKQTRICFVMPGGNYGYFPRGKGESHWHEEQPGIVHKTMRTGFGSPTGICFYEGNLLPKKYHGQLLHTDAGPRELRAFHIKPKGAGYELEKENLVTSTDNWFRLSDVCVAPDGSLMLADWYDPGVGGHGMGDWTRGRIYRVTPKGHKGYKVPELKMDSKEGQVDALMSPCLDTRYVGFGAILKTPFKERVKWLTPLIVQSNDSLRVSRLVSPLIGTQPNTSDPDFDNAEELGEIVGRKMATSRNLGVQAMRWIGNSDEIFEAKNARTMANAFDIRLVAELVLTLSRHPAEKIRSAFWVYAQKYDGQDIFYRAALNIACGTDPKRREAILADFDKHFPEWNDKVADLVWELRPASVLPRLGKLLEDAKLTAAQKGRIVDILAASDNAEAGKTMLNLLGGNASAEVKSKAIENLRTFLPNKWNALQKSPEIGQTINNLLAKAETRSAGLSLVAAANKGDAASKVQAIAGDEKVDLATRKEAVAVLGKLNNEAALDALLELGQPSNDLSVACTKAIGEHLPAGGKLNRHGERALQSLQLAINLEKASPEIKQAALEALAGSRFGTDWLLAQQEQKKLPTTLVSDAGRLLRNSPFQGQRNKAMLLFPAPGKLDPKKLPAPAVLAKRNGDVKRGEAVFKASLKGESQCLRCHTVNGVGGNIGPDLSMIGKKGSKENLIESILLPSKAIADQHVQWKVATLDGKSITGLLVEETPTSLTLRDANGKDHTFATKDLDGPKQKSLVSIMPDNLVAALYEDELIDLVEYMMTLKTASITPETWHIIGPFENDASDSALDKDLGLETAKEIDLSSTLKGKDGQVKWGTVRTNATGYIDLTAHYVGKSANSASYLYRVIESPTDQDAVLLFGNDDGAKVWINGKKVFENRDHFAATPERHRIPMKLKKGPNAVLIKIVNGNDPHGMYFALTSEQELKLAK